MLYDMNEKRGYKMIHTKDEILNYFKDTNIDVNLKNIDKFSANYISGALSISRSLASQYLNGFVKDEVLIKVTSRPVYFIYKEKLEEQYQIQLKENLYYSVQEVLTEILKKEKHKKNFNSIMGSETSLRIIVEQLKASLKYPGKGLPVILYGKEGVGKSSLCKEMFCYGLDNNVIDKEAQLCKVKVLHGQSDIVNKLVGNINDKGLFELSKGGIIYIQQAQNLSGEDQQKILKILEEGSFTRDGEEKIIPLKSRIVLSVDYDYKGNLDYDLIQFFPVICKVPNYDERFYEDKEEILIAFFKKQAINLRKKIFVNKYLLHTLMIRKYKSNLDELKNIIEDICARVNSECSKEDSELYIRMYHLPEYILLDFNEQDEAYEEKNNYINVDIYTKTENSTKMIELFDIVLNKLLTETNSVNYSIKNLVQELNQYYNAMINSRRMISHQSKVIEHSVNNSINKTLTLYNMSIPFYCSQLIAYSLHLKQCHSTKFHDWKIENKLNIKRSLHLLESNFKQGKVISDKINYSLHNNLEIEFDDIDKIILMINLTFYNESQNKSKYLSIIIAHGYATASSMAEAANILLGSYVFDAFDMPLDTSMIDIVERLKRYIERYAIRNDILLLVDMGSLEFISNHLDLIDDKNIGVINNVSTKLAIEIGEYTLQDLDMYTVLSKAAINSTSTFSLIENKSKKDLIIFISDNGIKMANRVKDLFVSSLPKMIDAEMMSFALEDIINPQHMAELETEYNLLFISGICSSGDKPDKFISLEDMITSNQLNLICIHLNKYLSIKEIDEFTSKLIHNFSLENVLNSLSILDAKKLLEFVEVALNQMQLLLERRLYGNTLAGLYIHICCMIERLVTKEPLQNNLGLEEFEVHNQRFIDIVNKSFTTICSHYGVEISLGEIFYLYDYIKEDKELVKEEGDF